MKLKIFTALLFVTSLLALESCQSKDLTREQAQKMIVANDEFQQIITLDYINRALKDNGHGTSKAKSPDEPENDSVQGRINEYYYEEPRVEIASFLGLVEPQIKRTVFQPARSSITKAAGFWQFDEKWTNTAKGNQMWTDYGLPAQESSVPLAKKEFVAISGITKIDEAQMEGNFTWRWSPNELGKCLDPSTQEFKSLPDNIQKNLVMPRSFVKEKMVYSWSGERPGKALFRRYDDGWRLERLHF